MSKTKKKNTTVKILALFIAILLWSYVRNEVNPKIVREVKNIDIDIINERLITDKGLVLSGHDDLKVSVKVEGRRSDLNSLKEEDISAEIDLSNATKGTQKIPIEVRVPFNVELADLSKRYISIELDNLNSIKRSVEINLLKSSDTQVLETSEVVPSTVELSGPSNLLNKVSEVVVDLDLKNLSSSGKMKLPVRLLDSKGSEVKGVKIDPEIVEVSVSVKSIKRVSITPSIVGEVGESFKIKSLVSNPKTIAIRGNEEDLRNIKTIHTENIDVSGITEDKTLTSSLVLPKGVMIEGGENTVSVTINLSNIIKTEDTTEKSEEAENETKTTQDSSTKSNKDLRVSTDKVNMRGLGDGFVASIVEVSEVHLSVLGDIQDLRNLTEGDISLTLPVEGLEEGIYDLNLEALASKGKIRDITPKTVRVKIEKKEKIEETEN